MPRGFHPESSIFALASPAGVRAAAARATAVGVLLAASPVTAHDFWIEPAPVHPGAERGLIVRLMVGEHFRGDEVPYQRSHALRFEHRSRGEVEALVGREGRGTAALCRVKDPGVHLISYASGPTAITLDASTFNRYLEAEGLKAILEKRQGDGQEDAPGRERFVRYAKAILVTDGFSDRDSTGGLVLGQKLEIVPEFDPVLLAQRPDSIGVRVLFDGRPLAGATVFALPQADPQGGGLASVTDAQGRVGFDLLYFGLWMVKVVHMAPCPSCPDADWESSWGNLVFWVGGG